MANVLLQVRAVAFAALLAGLFGQPAMACMCAQRPSVDVAYREAKAVFVGTTMDLTERPLEVGGRAMLGSRIESAGFLVERSWKGVKVGDVVRFRTDIGPGLCGLSCAGARATRSGGRWLIYAYGEQPFALSKCTRSAPADAASAVEDENALGALAGSAKPWRKLP